MFIRVRWTPACKGASLAGACRLHFWLESISPYATYGNWREKKYIVCNYQIRPQWREHTELICEGGGDGDKGLMSLLENIIIWDEAKLLNVLPAWCYLSSYFKTLVGGLDGIQMIPDLLLWRQAPNQLSKPGAVIDICYHTMCAFSY